MELIKAEDPVVSKTAEVEAFMAVCKALAPLSDTEAMLRVIDAVKILLEIDQ